VVDGGASEQKSRWTRGGHPGLAGERRNKRHQHGIQQFVHRATYRGSHGLPAGRRRALAVYRVADASKVDAPEGIVYKIVGVKANRWVAVIEGKQLE